MESETDAFTSSRPFCRIVALKFSLTPQPVPLSAGERLRFDVGSRTDLLLSDQSHGRAVSDAGAPILSPNTLHYGAETYVELRKVLARIYCHRIRLSMSLGATFCVAEH
jgi:hypothetical protein